MPIHTYNPPNTVSASPTAPFVIEYRLTLGRQGSTELWPQSRLIITEALRTSGLLASLPDRNAKSLLWLLTYLNPNGQIFAPVSLLARDMGISEKEVRKQFQALTTTPWNGGPLVHHLTQDTIERYTLSRHVAVEETSPTDLELPSPEPTYTKSRREEIIALSRELYANPREEVERQVLEQLGHHPEERADTPEGEARRGLGNVGVPRDQITLVLQEHGAEACLRQLEWLPLRMAKNPARYVVAAIQGNYSPPRGAKFIELAMESPFQEETGPDALETEELGAVLEELSIDTSELNV
ncbi:hypothetical protein [Armatimonas sp.]|uniref:hypothetical protein n=1 Tax=Armatimonas sp. TaxID=1872638 RepID=UPI00374D79EE